MSFWLWIWLKYLENVECDLGECLQSGWIDQFSKQIQSERQWWLDNHNSTID